MRTGLALVSTIAATGTAQPLFQTIGGLTGRNGSSFAHDLSRDGLTVVGASVNASGGTEAFAWTEGVGIRPLQRLPGVSATAFSGELFAVDGDGSTAVGVASNSAGVRRPVIADVDAGTLREMDFPPGTSIEIPNAISADGGTAVGSYNPPFAAPTGFRYNIATNKLDNLPATLIGNDTAVNGSIIVGFTQGGTGGAYLIRASGPFFLAPLNPATPITVANAISDNANFIVGTARDGSALRPARWLIAGPPIALYDGPDVRTANAEDVSEDGNWVVGSYFPSGGFFGAGWIWDTWRGFRSIEHALTVETGFDLSRFSEFRVAGISASGARIAGNVRDSLTGEGTAFVAELNQFGCNRADMTFPFGVLSQTDVSEFVDRFFQEDSRVTAFAPPDDVASQADVAVFVDLFFGGCPGAR
ncbi:MAG: hypothetical protein AAFR38_00635 [Planctomycetota bacterium]